MGIQRSSLITRKDSANQERYKVNILAHGLSASYLMQRYNKKLTIRNLKGMTELEF